MKRLILLLTLILLSVSANTSLKINGYDHQIVYWTFDHQFDKSLEMIEQKINEDPQKPKYYFLKIFALSLKNLADADQFNFEKRYEYRNQKNEELIKYAESVVKKLKRVEMTTENKFYLANIYGYLGRMHTASRSFFAAFQNAKKGKTLIEELVKTDPELYDAYLLLGMFEYYTDRLSGLTRFILSVLGLSGNRETGLEYLKLAHLKGELTRPMAEISLGETYTAQESNHFEAVNYFNLLIKKYKNNASFYDWYVRLQLQLNRLKDAEESIINDPNNHVWGYTKANFYFKNGDYEKAVELLNHLIETKDFKWRSAFENSKYLRAAALLLIDKPSLEYEKELNEQQRKIYDELKNNLTAAKEIFSYASSIGRMDENINTNLSSIGTIPGNGYLRAMYEFYTGVYFFNLSDADRADKFLTNVAKNRNYFQKEAAEYLLYMYKHMVPTQQQLAQLEKIIKDLDNDNLRFSFMDLKK